jgi:type I restriction enzyme S subunit
MKWEEKELKNYVNVLSGYAFKSKLFNKQEKGLPLIRVRDVGKSDPKTFYSGEYPKKYIIEKGDLLIAMDGEFRVSKWESSSALLNQRVCKISVNKDISIEYFKYFLAKVLKKIEDKTSFVTVKHLSVKKINSITIPLPPLPIQHQIADLLDTADALCRTTAEQLQQLDDLAESVFLEMFGDVVRNEKGWEKKQLRKIGKIQTGNTPPRSIEKYYGNDVEWIKTDNINIPQMYLSKAKEFLSLEGEKKGRTVDKGAILVTCIAGSKRVIGNPAISDRKVAFNQQINSISPYKASSLFLYYQFIIAQPYVQSFSTNGMKGMINKTAFGNIEFIIPPIELQNEFEKIIENIEVQKAELKQSLQDSEDLFKGLLQEIFN